MKYLLFFSVLSLVGCQSLQPKGLTLGIDFVKSPTAKQAADWRKNQTWVQSAPGEWTAVRPVKEGASSASPVLINGNPVDKAKYPAVLRIRSASGSGCTASLVGPQAVLTAAHCAEQGEKISFTTVNGATYTANVTRYEKWPNDDLDLAIAKVSKPVTGITPLTVRTDRFEKKGMNVDLIGYGCVQPGGGGGNDGVLRMGSAKIRSGQAYDLVLDADPSALCYGDSGGPVLFEGKQIGVNSKGNIEDVSYTTRTTLPDAKAWLEATASKLGVAICGVTSNCDGSNPDPEPGPKQFMFENELIKIQGIIK